MNNILKDKSKSAQRFIEIVPNSPIVVELKKANEEKDRRAFVRVVGMLDGIAEFIERNENSNIVTQLKESDNIEASYQLVKKIREAIWIEWEIKREQDRIQSHINSIEDISREIRIKEGLLKNSLNFHKIKRNSNK